ncbi:MAG TPA: hypothetical protein VFH27_07670 [Longimicrobiaceae bacterium]|nr:hypothetical protein [Longimicrobiaceae bacterium]
MRLKTLALLVPAAALMAACQDQPVASADRSLYDMSDVRVTRGDGTGGHLMEHGLPSAARSTPRFMCDANGCDPRPRPLASFDYGSYTEQSTSGGNKSVHLVAWSDNYAHINTMSITGSFRSVGGSGPSGCNATPSQFDSETQSGAGNPWGGHLTLFVERTATYPSSQTWVYEVVGSHYFQASLGYSVDGYYRDDTFSSSAKTCY